MKLAISNIAWDEKYNEEMYEFLNKNEINYLEIALTKFVLENTYDNIEEFKKIFDELKNKYNINVCSIQSIMFKMSENMFNSNEERIIINNHIKKVIKFCGLLNIKNIVFGCPKNRNINNINTFIEPVDFFKELGDYAVENNTIFSIEANPKIYGTNYINNTMEALELVKKVNSSGLKINLDMGTIIENNEDISILDNNIDYINHVHISMPYLKEIDVYNKKIIEVIKYLKNNNYDKIISIEMGNIDNLDKVKEIVLYFKELINE